MCGSGPLAGTARTSRAREAVAPKLLPKPKREKQALIATRSTASNHVKRLKVVLIYVHLAIAAATAPQPAWPRGLIPPRAIWVFAVW